jgi:hypothetical protein
MLKKTLILLLMGAATALPGAAQSRKPAAAPTAVPTPVPPERVPSSQRKGVAPEKRVARYENANVSFSKLTSVQEVDLDNDGVFEALVEGIGTVRSLPPGIPVVGFVSRTRLPFENPIAAVFQRGRGNEWDLLLVAHLPQRCKQSDDPVRCDGLVAFRAEEFRYDDRPQIALQITHSGEARVTETSTFRLDRGRLETTFTATGPRSGLDVSFGPDGIVRRIAVDTFINKDLPPRYRSFTLTSSFVFGERRFRIASEVVEPEWSEKGDLDLSYWGLVHQSTFASDLARLQERQRRAPAEAPWSLDPLELVKKRFSDARDVRVGSKHAGLAVVYFECVGCPAHIVLFQPLRETEGEKSIWDFAVIRSPEEPAYECLMEAAVKGN